MVRTLVPLTTRFPHRFGNLHEEMENLLDFALRGDSATTAWTPRMNVTESDAGYDISLELPGVQPDNVNVELEDGRLTISGSIEEETKDEGKTLHRVERRTGDFRRVLTLPEEVDADKIDAKFEHGVLTVVIPKAEKVQPKRIEIKTK